MSLFRKRGGETEDTVIEESVNDDPKVEPTKEERNATKNAKKSGITEIIRDDYDESDRTLSHEDAHRDAVYELPSTFRQILVCYMTQMKRFTKERTIWGLLILLALIPLIYYALDSSLGMSNSHVTNIFIAMPLMLMPIISMIVCSTVCGSMLPREYNERTVYLSLPLPMSRFAFYIGKFLAGLTLCWGVITAAYGLSIILALTIGKTDVTYSSPMFTSLMIMMETTFFLCAFVYMLSANSKRGSAMKSMLLLIVVIPIFVLVVQYLPNAEAFASFKEPLTVLSDLVVYLPVLGPDLALTHLGQSMNAVLMGVSCFSVFSFANAFVPIDMSMDVLVMTIVSIVLGVICLAVGYMRIRRRDM